MRVWKTLGFIEGFRQLPWHMQRKVRAAQVHQIDAGIRQGSTSLGNCVTFLKEGDNAVCASGLVPGASLIGMVSCLNERMSTRNFRRDYDV